MLTRILETLQVVGTAVYELYTLPGRLALPLIVTHAPGLAAWFTIDQGLTPERLAFWISPACWILIVVLVVCIVRLGRNITRYTGALLRSALYRASNFLAGIMVTMSLRLRSLFAHRRRAGIEVDRLIEFDDLDMAVLRTVLAKGPGFALSAPDIAGPFRLRPMQVQRSLDKLSRNKMLASVIGSTDGYENYRLTDYGEAYLATIRANRR